jgi:hypothetical protein
MLSHTTREVNEITVYEYPAIFEVDDIVKGQWGTGI